MSFNARFVALGESVDYVPGADVAAGAVVIQGNLVGIAKLDIASGALGAIAIEGLYDVVKDSAAVISAGGKVYWNATSSYATSVASGNTQIGLATAVASSGTTIVRVALNK